MNKDGWVYTVNEIGGIPENTVGYILDKKMDSYFICFFSEMGKSYQVVGKKWVRPYPIEQEMEDLQFLIDFALEIRDYEWVKELNYKFPILSYLLDEKNISVKMG